MLEAVVVVMEVEERRMPLADTEDTREAVPGMGMEPEQGVVVVAVARTAPAQRTGRDGGRELAAGCRTSGHSSERSAFLDSLWFRYIYLL